MSINVQKYMQVLRKIRPKTNKPGSADLWEKEREIRLAVGKCITKAFYLCLHRFLYWCLLTVRQCVLCKIFLNSAIVKPSLHECSYFRTENEHSVLSEKKLAPAGRCGLVLVSSHVFMRLCSNENETPSQECTSCSLHLH